MKECENKAPYVMVEWLTLLLHVQEAPGSNLDLKNGYPD
jgi:hypothetical protein